MNRDPFLARLPTPIRVGILGLGWGFVLAVLLPVSAHSADRACGGVPAAAEASIKPIMAHLRILADGGCAASIEAELKQLDGGFLPPEQTPFVEVTGANRTVCKDITEVKGLILFKSQNGPF